MVENVDLVVMSNYTISDADEIAKLFEEICYLIIQEITYSRQTMRIRT